MLSIFMLIDTSPLRRFGLGYRTVTIHATSTQYALGGHVCFCCILHTFPRRSLFWLHCTVVKKLHFSLEKLVNLVELKRDLELVYNWNFGSVKSQVQCADFQGESWGTVISALCAILVISGAKEHFHFPLCIFYFCTFSKFKLSKCFSLKNQPDLFFFSY